MARAFLVCYQTQFTVDIWISLENIWQEHFWYVTKLVSKHIISQAHVLNLLLFMSGIVKPDPNITITNASKLIEKHLLHLRNIF